MEKCLPGWGNTKSVFEKAENNFLTKVPNLLIKMDNPKISAISCGRHHTLAVCDNGNVLSWGSGKYGKLGNRSESYIHFPHYGSVISDVIQVACGSKHSLFLKENGEVFSCGYNVTICHVFSVGKTSFTNYKSSILVICYLIFTYCSRYSNMLPL